MLGKVGQREFYVSAGKPGLFGFDTATGEKIFSDPNTGNNVAVIPTPILDGEYLYHTSAYGAGNTLLKLTPSSNEVDAKLNAESVYHLAGKTMENHHGGVVYLDGVLYGFSKTGGGCWMAQELETGKTLWQQKARPNKSGSICFADGMLYCYGDKDGSVTLVEPNPNEFVSHGTLKLPRQTSLARDKGAIWAHPVVANQTLFIRDQDLLYAFDIAR